MEIRYRIFLPFSYSYLSLSRVLLLLSITMLASVGGAGATLINNCTIINAPDVYVLNTNIIDASLSPGCIQINSSNVTLDGAGYAIDGIGDSSTFGVFVFSENASFTNVTIKNLVVTDWGSGILLFNVSYSNITNNTANNNTGALGEGSPSSGIILIGSNSTVKNNRVQNNSIGIIVANPGPLYTFINNTIADNIASNNSMGIYLYNISYTTIVNNTADNNTGLTGDGGPISTGILLMGSHNNITDNTLQNNLAGIIVSTGDPSNPTETTNNTLTANKMSANTYNFYIDGLSISDFIHNIDASNTVDDKPIYYLVGYSNTVINSSNNTGFVGVVNSVNVTVKDLTLTKNGEGVLFVNTTNSLISNVTASENQFGIGFYVSSNTAIAGNNASNNTNGILLFGSNDNNITGNIITSNNGTGIVIDSSDYNNISDNVIAYSNGDGIWLGNSNYNTITNNNASNSVEQNGVSLGDSHYNNVTNNTANSNFHNGVNLYSSSTNNTVVNNTVGSNNDQGIIIHESSHGNTILGNDASNNNQSGIRIDSSNNNTLTGNTANLNNGTGINLANLSNYNTLTNNTANLNNESGICLQSSSSDNALTDNTANENNRYGISLSSSSSNTVKDNTAWNNTDDGIFLTSSSNNNLTSNNASNNFNGILLESSNNNNVTKNTASNNDKSGISLESSGYNTIANNTAPNNAHGIRLTSSNSSSITNNNASSNDDRGIWLASSNNNTIVNNNVTSNAKGIYLDSSNNNTIYHNNIVGSTELQALDYGSNAWDDGYLSGGNYWSNWTTPDKNLDGIVDYLYIIPNGANEDKYPLTKQDGWLNVTPSIPPPPITTIFQGNAIENQTIILDFRNQTGVYIELVPETNSTLNVTVGIATNVSSVNASSMIQAGSLNKYVAINVTGDKINSTANISRAYIQVNYSIADLDTNEDGDANDVGDVNENTLKMYWYWPAEESWVLAEKGSNLSSKGGPVVSDTDKNTTEKYVWANISHFSVYGIAGDVIQAYTPQSGGGGGGGAAKPKIVLVGNSIDLGLAGNFTGFLKNQGIDIVYANASNFTGDLKTQKFIIILGGPDAPEGIGNITKSLLTDKEQEQIRTKGNRKMYVKTNVWKSYNQVVFIAAGCCRNCTKECSEEHKLAIDTKVRE